MERHIIIGHLTQSTCTTCYPPSLPRFDSQYFNHCLRHIIIAFPDREPSLGWERTRLLSTFVNVPYSAKFARAKFSRFGCAKDFAKINFAYQIVGSHAHSFFVVADSCSYAMTCCSLPHCFIFFYLRLKHMQGNNLHIQCTYSLNKKDYKNILPYFSFLFRCELCV